jgi:hypothetical protein
LRKYPECREDLGLFQGLKVFLAFGFSGLTFINQLSEVFFDLQIFFFRISFSRFYPSKSRKNLV